MTARHVLHDMAEARAAVVTLFDHTEDGSGQVTLTGGEWVGGNTERDVCVVNFHTHDAANTHTHT